MKFVATKTADQLDLQALHPVRERLVRQRTGIINQIRAFLLERGVAVRERDGCGDRQWRGVREGARLRRLAWTGAQADLLRPPKPRSSPAARGPKVRAAVQDELTTRRYGPSSWTSICSRAG